MIFFHISLLVQSLVHTGYLFGNANITPNKRPVVSHCIGHILLLTLYSFVVSQNSQRPAQTTKLLSASYFAKHPSKGNITYHMTVQSMLEHSVEENTEVLLQRMLKEMKQSLTESTYCTCSETEEEELGQSTVKEMLRSLKGLNGSVGRVDKSSGNTGNRPGGLFKLDIIWKYEIVLKHRLKKSYTWYSFEIGL